MSVVDLPAVDWQSDAMKARRARRYAADRRLQVYGMIAVGFALGFLALLIGTISMTGRHAFAQTMATVEIDLAGAEIDRSDLMGANWRGIVRDRLKALVPDLPRSDERDYFGIFTSSAHFGAMVGEPHVFGSAR